MHIPLAARGRRPSRRYCRVYTPYDQFEPEPTFIVKIKYRNGSYFVFLNDKKLPNPALRQGAPLHFLAYKLVELAGPGRNADYSVSMRIVDPTAVKMLKTILHSSKNRNKPVAGQIVLAFGRYSTRSARYTKVYLSYNL